MKRCKKRLLILVTNAEDFNKYVRMLNTYFWLTPEQKQLLEALKRKLFQSEKSTMKSNPKTNNVVIPDDDNVLILHADSNGLYISTGNIRVLIDTEKPDDYLYHEYLAGDKMPQIKRRAIAQLWEIVEVEGFS